MFIWHLTLTPPSSRSLKLHVKYFENGDRYDDGVNGSRIRNHLWAIDWHRDLWPWMTLKRPSSRSLQLYSNISITVYRIQRTTLGRYTFHRTYFLLKLKLSNNSARTVSSRSFVNVYNSFSHRLDHIHGLCNFKKCPLLKCLYCFVAGQNFLESWWKLKKEVVY